MKQEDKILLLKDLSARLPYGVIVDYKEGEHDFHKWKIETLYAPAYSESGLLIETSDDGWIGYTEYNGCGMSSASRPLHLDKNRPYLRPLSSMTEEEEVFYNIIYPHLKFYEKEDWLNAHHFDYRIDPSTGKTLIESGLALEALKGMYKTV